MKQWNSGPLWGLLIRDYCKYAKHYEYNRIVVR